MKRISKIIIASTMTMMLFFSFSSTVFALEKEYTVLAPLPGLQKDDGQTTLDKYLPNAFNLTITIAAVMAFVMITFGGIMYATSDAISGKSQGKTYVTEAIYGLLLVIGAWVILNTINPKILEFNLNIDKVVMENATPTVTTARPMTQAELDADRAVRASLPAGITVYRGPCTNGQTTNCVNMNGVKPEVINGLKVLQQKCDCIVEITGGTEGGHTTNSSHYTGHSVDIRSNDAIKKAISEAQETRRTLEAGNVYTLPGSGGGFLWEPENYKAGEVSSSGDHFHATF